MFKSHFHTYVAGIKHHRKAFYALDLEQREHSLELIEEPENKHDPNAIKVIVDGQHIGYVPAKKCEKVKKILTKTITETRFVHEENEIDDDNIDFVNEIHIWYK
ncbi:MAG: HIRAN domain-containing protein [Aeriscardovia sp.]|nr:HIRAN domain-containing protein [Aeriscardovia sp.]